MHDYGPNMLYKLKITKLHLKTKEEYVIQKQRITLKKAKQIKIRQKRIVPASSRSPGPGIT